MYDSSKQTQRRENNQSMLFMKSS